MHSGSLDVIPPFSARQIQQLHFVDHATELTAARSSRRVLERLVRQRLLARLERRIGGVRAGSAAFVYALGALGFRVLHGDSSRRRREPSEAFVLHTLAVAQIVVDLTGAARTGNTELLDYETEPRCWRRFSKGLSGTENVKPDLYVITATAEHEFRWFIEVDLGTESGTAIARKTANYTAYWKAGEEQRRHGIFPKVLWIADTPRRAGLIKRALTKTRNLHQPLFEVTTNENALDILSGSAA